jgi:hypothetical protein
VLLPARYFGYKDLKAFEKDAGNVLIVGSYLYIDVSNSDMSHRKEKVHHVLDASDTSYYLQGE